MLGLEGRGGAAVNVIPLARGWDWITWIHSISSNLLRYDMSVIRSESERNHLSTIRLSTAQPYTEEVEINS